MFFDVVLPIFHNYNYTMRRFQNFKYQIKGIQCKVEQVIRALLSLKR
jgi:hypothetical protein